MPYPDAVTLRASPDDVRAIMPLDSTFTDAVITQFIIPANSMVNELCTNSGYDDNRLTAIEIWLSAHYLYVQNPPVMAEGVGKANIQYGGKIGDGFGASRYGIMAMRMDTAGTLANMEIMMQKGLQKRKLGIVSIGPNRCAPAPYGCCDVVPTNGMQPFTDVQ